MTCKLYFENLNALHIREKKGIESQLRVSEIIWALYVLILLVSLILIQKLFSLVKNHGVEFVNLTHNLNYTKDILK